MHVLDTNTVSYFFRGEPGVVERMMAHSPAEIGVPAIVIYELRAGLLRLPAGAARTERLAALRVFLMPLEILPFDEPAADEAADIKAGLQASGSLIGPHDILIAATARANRATLVTHNVREFSRVPELLIEDWHRV